MSQETIILGANAQRTERLAGRFFTVISATAKFDVELDGRKRRTVRAGSKVSGDRFRRISFFETEGVTNTVVFDAGDEDYQGEVQVSGVSDGTFDYSLAALGGGGVFLSHTSKLLLTAIYNIGGVDYTRKSFHITNSSAQDIGIYEVRSGASLGKLLDICISNTERAFSFSQDVELKPTGGVDATIALYYTLYNTTPQTS